MAQGVSKILTKGIKHRSTPLGDIAGSTLAARRAEIAPAVKPSARTNAARRHDRRSAECANGEADILHAGLRDKCRILAVEMKGRAVNCGPENFRSRSQLRRCARIRREQG